MNVEQLLDILKKAETLPKLKAFVKKLNSYEKLPWRLFTHLDQRYYEIGVPEITDLQYDFIKEEMQKLHPNHKYFKQVGAKVSFGEKVRLPKRMGSLDKTRPSTIHGWLDEVDKKASFVITPKIDGLSGVLEFENGFLKCAYKRGDGIVGHDVTRNATYIKGVPFKDKRAFFIEGKVYISGEFCVMNYQFQKFKSDGYKNPRNFSVGMLNSKELTDDVKKGLRSMIFLTYEFDYEGPDEKLKNLNKLERLSLLRQLGFITVERPQYPMSSLREAKVEAAHKLEYKCLLDAKYNPLVNKVKDELRKSINALMKPHHGNQLYISYRREHITPSNLRKLIDYFKRNSGVLLDGLVIEVNDYKLAQKMGLGANGLNPNWAKSIKLDIKDQDSQIGIVKEIQWNYTKRRLYKPVVKLKNPLEFFGVEVRSVTAYNAKFIVDMGIYPGVKVKICRSGDVIPRLIAVKQGDKWIKCV